MKVVRKRHYELVISDILHIDPCRIKGMGGFEMFLAHLVHNALSLNIQ